MQLRLMRDRFVAGHENCALQRNLDSVPERALPVYTVDEPACMPVTGWWRLLLFLLGVAETLTAAPPDTHGNGDLAGTPTVGSAGVLGSDVLG